MTRSFSTVILATWKWSRLPLYVGSLSNDLFGWLVVSLVHAFWGQKGYLKWEAGVLRTVIKQDSWLNKKVSGWKGLTVTAHAMIYRNMLVWPEDRDTPHSVQYHEHAHCEQAESANLKATVEAIGLAILLGVLGYPVTAAVVFLVWMIFMGHLVTSLYHKLTAVLRGEDHYWGSSHEEAARALAKNPRV